MVLSRHVLHDESIFPSKIGSSKITEGVSKVSTVPNSPIVVNITHGSRTHETLPTETQSTSHIPLLVHDSQNGSRSSFSSSCRQFIQAPIYNSSNNGNSATPNQQVTEHLQGFETSNSQAPSQGEDQIQPLLHVLNPNQLQVILPFTSSASSISDSIQEPVSITLHPMQTRLKT